MNSGFDDYALLRKTKALLLARKEATGVRVSREHYLWLAHIAERAQENRDGLIELARKRTEENEDE